MLPTKGQIKVYMILLLIEHVILTESLLKILTRFPLKYKKYISIKLKLQLINSSNGCS